MLEGISARQLVDILISCEINARQFMLLFFLYPDRLESGGQLVTDGPAVANVYRFADHVELWPQDEVDDLVAKGWLVDRNKVRNAKKEAFPDLYEGTTSPSPVGRSASLLCPGISGEIPDYTSNSCRATNRG